MIAILLLALAAPPELNIYDLKVGQEGLVVGHEYKVKAVVSKDKLLIEADPGQVNGSKLLIIKDKEAENYADDSRWIGGGYMKVMKVLEFRGRRYFYLENIDQPKE